jgi:hypothetical protein
LRAQLSRAVAIVVAIHQLTAHRRRGRRIAQRLPLLEKGFEGLLPEDLPGLLGEHHQLRTEDGRLDGGIRGDADRIDPILEAAGRPRADFDLWMREELGVGLEEALVECLEDERGALVVTPPRLVHRAIEARVLALGEPSPEAEQRPPLALLIQQGDLGCDAIGIVPGHDHRARAELDALGRAGDLCQPLDVVWAHRVVEEMVLGRPIAVIAELVGQLR